MEDIAQAFLKRPGVILLKVLEMVIEVPPEGEEH
jgi:hypothetical protein